MKKSKGGGNGKRKHTDTFGNNTKEKTEEKKKLGKSDRMKENRKTESERQA